MTAYYVCLNSSIFSSIFMSKRSCQFHTKIVCIYFVHFSDDLEEVRNEIRNVELFCQMTFAVKIDLA